jgi:hypothetical protein
MKTIDLTLDDFLRPASMTCLECMADSVVYPSMVDQPRRGRLVCPKCSPAGLGDLLSRRLRAERAEAGLAPLSESEETVGTLPSGPVPTVREWLLHHAGQSR